MTPKLWGGGGRRVGVGDIYVFCRKTKSSYYYFCKVTPLNLLLPRNPALHYTLIIVVKLYSDFTIMWTCTSKCSVRTSVAIITYIMHVRKENICEKADHLRNITFYQCPIYTVYQCPIYGR